MKIKYFTHSRKSIPKSLISRTEIKIQFLSKNSIFTFSPQFSEKLQKKKIIFWSISFFWQKFQFCPNVFLSIWKIKIFFSVKKIWNMILAWTFKEVLQLTNIDFDWILCYNGFFFCFSVGKSFVANFLVIVDHYCRLLQYFWGGNCWYDWDPSSWCTSWASMGLSPTVLALTICSFQFFFLPPEDPPRVTCQTHNLTLITYFNNFLPLNSTFVLYFVLKNRLKCHIWVFQFWHFPPIFVLLKNNLSDNTAWQEA